MKIAIDISQVAYQGTGVSRFTEGLIGAVCQYAPEHEWIFYYSALRTPLPKQIYNTITAAHKHIRHAHMPPRILSILHNQLHKIPFEVMVGTPLDWYISSDWTQAPARCRRATIVHDLVFHRYPDTVASIIRSAQAQRLHWAQRECEVIFCDSESTKADYEQYAEVPNARVITNYPGVNQVQTIEPPLVEEVRNRYQLTKPFILAVGKLEPRKNLHRLIASYLRLYRNDIDLVIVGQSGWDVSAQQLVEQATSSTNAGAAARELKVAAENIHFLGFVPDADLHALYQSCACFVFPSLWEGFGYPLIEAMQHGVPIGCSNTSSLKELGKDIAVFFDPEDVSDMTRALNIILRDGPDIDARVATGRKRASEFSWQRYVQTMMKELSKQ